MRLVLRFEHLNEYELTTVVRDRCHALDWPVEDEVLRGVARRAKGVPRLALRLLQACRRVARSEGDYVLRWYHLERACELEQIDTLGLGPVEQRYLRTLAEGNTRLNVLATVIGLPGKTVTQVIEPFLIRSGLVVKDDQGRRQLTARGRQHLSDSRTDGV
jgi:Holliday junction DNA helicase RuvB